MSAAVRIPAARVAIAWSLALTGCWKEDLAALPLDSMPFAPTALEAPDGWRVTPIEVDLTCPDGEAVRFHLLHPEQAPSAPGPAAVLFHSGAFDFVYAPMAADPVAGPHHAWPSRLDARWSIRHVFASLGMLPSEIDGETHLGGITVALAERGVPVLLPANCWGDLWHNRRALAQNDFQADLFARDGRTAAEWAVQLLADPVFAESMGIELPIQADPASLYLVGLGEGGQAVAELLAIDADEDGAPDHAVAGALVDSHAANLAVYFDDPARFDAELTGLHRIFPGGAEEAAQTALHTVPLPPRLGYLYASADPTVPVEAHARVVERLGDDAGHWVHVEEGARHILLDGQDMPLAREAVDFLLAP